MFAPAEHRCRVDPPGDRARADGACILPLAWQHRAAQRAVHECGSLAWPLLWVTCCPWGVYGLSMFCLRFVYFCLFSDAPSSLWLGHSVGFCETYRANAAGNPSHAAAMFNMRLPPHPPRSGALPRLFLAHLRTSCPVIAAALRTHHGVYFLSTCFLLLLFVYFAAAY